MHNDFQWADGIDISDVDRHEAPQQGGNKRKSNAAKAGGYGGQELLLLMHRKEPLPKTAAGALLGLMMMVCLVDYDDFAKPDARLSCTCNSFSLKFRHRAF